uniref:Glutathione hydrolase n=1 Tax=Mastacembelus armatus TaxID=205130 RepID=A0A3Q3NFE7_9TELE
MLDLLLPMSWFACCFLAAAPDLSQLSKEIPLKQLASGSPDVFSQSLSNVNGTEKDGSSQDMLTPIYAVTITFAIGVTIALILHIYLGEVASQVFVKGALVSDHERCTTLGQRVLHDHGSSVDAAIATVLCLGVVHPHVSGIGGGGVMMVHDIHKNETRVINFQGTAPRTLTEDMLQNVSELKAGLQVGVPGMLRGLHLAHWLHGSLSWEDVVMRAAAVAREGFNVSFSLAKLKGEQLSQHFRGTFFPGGKPLRPGSFLRLPGLARVLEAGLSKFYDGNFSQEIVDEVRMNGGVLSREDISNYSVKVEQPAEGLYNEFIIQVPPPPSAGAALISAFNILEGFHLNDINNTDNQTNHWITEALNAAVAMASGLGDPKYDSSVTKLLSHMLSKNHADVLHQRINYSHASPPENYSSTPHSLQTELQAGQVVVMGPDDLVVSVASSLGRNRVQPGKRPLSYLTPTIVMPAWYRCGIYLAVSSSGGKQRFSAITQLMFALNDITLVISCFPNCPSSAEFLEDDVLLLYEDSHVFQKVKTNFVVQGILRSEDNIKAIAIPLSDGSL